MTEEVKAVAVLDDFDVSVETKENIKASFNPYFEKAQAIEEKAKLIVVTSVDQKKEMKEARAMRLEIKKIRLETESKRKDMKAESLRKGKAIDGMANIIKFLVVPTEEYLLKQENFAKVIEEQKAEAVFQQRREDLKLLNIDPDVYNLKGMAEDKYLELLGTLKRADEARIAAEKKAKEEKAQKDKEFEIEQERIRKENFKLKAEADKRAEEDEIRKAAEEDELAERQEREAAERKVIEDRERKEREAHEAELQKERDKREKLEAEIEAKKKKEKADLRAKVKAENKAALAPDKQKLEKFAEEFAYTKLPDVSSPEAREILKKAVVMINGVRSFIEEQIVEL